MKLMKVVSFHFRSMCGLLIAVAGAYYVNGCDTGPCGSGTTCVDDSNCASTAFCRLGCCVPDLGVPTVDCGAEQTVVGGAQVFLGAAVEDDRGVANLAFAWSRTAGPGQVILQNADRREASFVAPPMEGRHDFQLEVQDQDGNIVSCTVSVNVVAEAEPVDVCQPACVPPETCGGGGVNNQCGCTEETDSAFCERLAKNCGTVSEFDNCGNAREVDCGECTSPATCGGLGVNNVCGAPVARIAAGGNTTCAATDDGLLVCWGQNEFGQLGYGDTETIGDDETPASKGPVPVGDIVFRMTAGGDHTCALISNGQVRCWGANGAGQLGYATTSAVGDDEPIANAGVVATGGPVSRLAAGGRHTCVVIAGSVRCWGEGVDGQLGYGDTETIGDDEAPSSIDTVNVGRGVLQVATGRAHTCSVALSERPRCWGRGAAGALGYGDTETIGDDEEPASVGDVDTGAGVVDVTAGDDHSCALRTDEGTVMCWGDNSQGQLGYPNVPAVGDDETPASVGTVDVGGTVEQVVAGGHHTCALLSNGTIRCWGRAAEGQLGYGNTTVIGDNETPASVDPVDIGGVAIAIAAGANHTCALLSTGAVRCWGSARFGQLGYASTSSIGDDESPASAPLVPIF